MSSKINLLIINCRDFNFPHAGNVDVKLMRVKHYIKVKVITYLPKKISTRTDYYISHTENFTWEAITNNGVREVYDELLLRLNYTDKFISHYGYSDGDVAGAYENDVEYISWLTDTLFSFNADTFIVSTDKRTMFGGRSTVDAIMGVDKSSGLDKSVVTTVRGGVEASKELKVSPLADRGLMKKLLGDIDLPSFGFTPEEISDYKKRAEEM